MAFWMVFLLLFLMIQRLVELRIARGNERWMIKHGGIEKGKQHYKWFVFVHALFFLSLIVETLLRDAGNHSFHFGLFAVFALVQLGRVWCIKSLGRFWNTKIIVLPSVAVIQKGPYKYVKHPNYIIVALEMIVIPLLFGAYYTAFIFPLIHLMLLKVRIPEEEKALAIND